jgi:hypothetical protein
VSLNQPPVVHAPANVRSWPLFPVLFPVHASDPDREPIQSLTMDKSQLPAGSNAWFIANNRHTSGLFFWLPGRNASGMYAVTFTARNSLVGSTTTKIMIQRRVTEGDMEFEGGRPATLSFSNGFPNPSRGEVDFSVEMPEAGDVDWVVYDAQGRVVHSESRSLPAGRHTVRWDGLTTGRQPASTGVYFVRAKVAGEEFVRRVVRF